MNKLETPFNILVSSMQKLDEGTIALEKAKTQASLGKQINNIVRNELSRTETLERKVRGASFIDN